MSTSKRKRAQKNCSIRRKTSSSDNEAETLAFRSYCSQDGAKSPVESIADEDLAQVRSCCYSLRSGARRKTTAHTADVCKSSILKKRARKVADDVTEAHAEVDGIVKSLEGEFSSLERSKELAQISSKRDESASDKEKVENEMDGDDEAPQDFSLADAKQQAIHELHQMQASQHRLSQEAKVRKRQKHELYRLQKEQKQHQRFDRFDEEELKEIAMTIRNDEDWSDTRSSVKKPTIPIKKKPTSYKKRSVRPVEVMVLEREPSKAAAASLEEARAFLQCSLYGDRHNRASALTVNARKYTSTPAANFN